MAEHNQGTKEFNWSDFELRLSEQDLHDGQRSMLEMRLDVVRSFMPRIPSSTKAKRAKESSYKDSLTGFPGQLTVVDLTDPMLDSETACVLFDIALTQFVDRTSGGKVIALDEAHNVSICYVFQLLLMCSVYAFYKSCRE
jgi:hypothetical protein